jgi:hypothetical protein
VYIGRPSPSVTPIARTDRNASQCSSSEIALTPGASGKGSASAIICVIQASSVIGLLLSLTPLLNDALHEERTSINEVVEGIAAVDWTWSNRDFQKNIGRMTPEGAWRFNTGTATLSYLIGYLRPRCNIRLVVAA